MSRKMVIAGVAGVLVGTGLGFFRFHSTDGQTATASQPSRSAVKAGGVKQIVPVPRFATHKNDEPLETNPAKPGYDPTRFRGIIMLPDLYRREPRHEVWAKAIEAHLTQGLTADLAKILPQVTIEPIECRYTLCRLVWKGPQYEERRLLRVIDVLFPAESMGFGVNNVIYLTYKGPVFYQDVVVGDPSSLLSAMSAARAKELKTIRDLNALARSHGKKMPDHGIPEDAWPDK